MNRQEIRTVGRFHKRAFGKVTIAIAIVAFWWLSACPEEAQAQRLRGPRGPRPTRVGGNQILKKPPATRIPSNAPQILSFSDIEKRSVTIRFQNFAADVSQMMLERKLENSKSWGVAYTISIRDQRGGAFDPTVRDHRRIPGATYVARDKNVTPGVTYQYRVRATQPYEPRRVEILSAVRTVTTKPPEPPANPSGLKVIGTTDTTVSLSWTDNADNETSFLIRYRKKGDTSWGTQLVRGANTTSGDLVSLKPNSEYEIAVRARNEDGLSSHSNHVSAKTKESSSTPTTEVTKTVSLKAQPINQGPQPYAATWPTSGTIPGYLTKIEVPQVFGPTLYVHFVKRDHSTAECGVNPDATVTLASGQTSTQSQLSEIFGAAQPKFPITFVACVGASQGTVPSSVDIKITYTKTD